MLIAWGSLFFFAIFTISLIGNTSLIMMKGEIEMAVIAVLTGMVYIATIIMQHDVQKEEAHEQ